MGLGKTIVVAGLAMSIGGAVMSISYATGDPALVPKSLGAGFQQTAALGGEVVKVPGKVVTAARPGIQDLAHQGQGFLGGAAADGGGGAADEVDPSTQGKGAP